MEDRDYPTASPEEYGMQPYEPRAEMDYPNDANSPAGLAAAAHKKKSKWWLYVLIVLRVLVGGVLLMGILNKVSKDGSSIAKNIYSMSKYLAYASIIFAGLSALRRFAYNKYQEKKGEGKPPGDTGTTGETGETTTTTGDIGAVKATLQKAKESFRVPSIPHNSLINNSNKNETSWHMSLNYFCFHGSGHRPFHLFV